MRAGEVLEFNTFLAVAETGRFTAAAVRLGVTPSGVSQSVRRLEARLGARLFNRTTRSLALTAAGEALLAQVKPALERLSQVEPAFADGVSAAPRRIRLSVSAVAMELHLAPALPAFRRAHPDVQLEITVEDRLVDPVAGRFDAVIRRGGLLEQDLIARKLGADDALILVAAPRYLAGAPSLDQPRDLRRHALVSIRRPRTGALLPWKLASGDQTAEVRASGGLTVEGAAVARDCALQGLGIALLARRYVEPLLRRAALRHVLPAWSQPIGGFHLMYAGRGSLAPALRKLEREMRRT